MKFVGALGFAFILICLFLIYLVAIFNEKFQKNKAILNLMSLEIIQSNVEIKKEFTSEQFLKKLK